MNETTPQTTFNADEFLDSEIENAFVTIRTTIPAGDAYIGVIDKLATRVSKAGRPMLDIFWHILDDALAVSLNLEKAICRQTVFLDFDQNGRLAWGTNQNVQLGQVRDALGQNQPGPWKPRQLQGAGPARLKVIERPDEDNPLIKFNDVKLVTKMAA